MKEKSRGSISGRVKPDTGQANFSENRDALGAALVVDLCDFLSPAPSADGGRRVRVFDHRQPFGEFQRGLKTFGEALTDVGTHHNAIDHNVDVMWEFLVERGHFRKFVKRASILTR